MQQQKEYIFELPHPPSLNSYWLNDRSGRRYLSKKATQYRIDVNTVLQNIGLKDLKLNDRLFYYCEYYAPDKRKRDIDNFCTKAVLDALTHAGLYEDDSQIDEVYYKRCEIIKNGKLLIKIRVI
jgi:crossover junction endodeoxyribonuclease RusA